MRATARSATLAAAAAAAWACSGGISAFCPAAGRTAQLPAPAQNLGARHIPFEAPSSSERSWQSHAAVAAATALLAMAARPARFASGVERSESSRGSLIVAHAGQFDMVNFGDRKGRNTRGPKQYGKYNAKTRLFIDMDGVLTMPKWRGCSEKEHKIKRNLAKPLEQPKMNNLHEAYPGVLPKYAQRRVPYPWRVREYPVIHEFKWEHHRRGSEAVPVMSEKDERNRKYGIDMSHLHRKKFKQGGLVTHRGYPMKRRWELWLKYAHHFFDDQSKTYKWAIQKVRHNFCMQMNSRKQMKHRMKRIWKIRLDNNCRLHGFKMQQFQGARKVHKVTLNRKILTQLGVIDRAVLTNVFDIVVPSWPKRLAHKTAPPPSCSTSDPEYVKKMDDAAIGLLEREHPDLYTSPNIRFNRKVYPDGRIRYSVAQGEPSWWQETLPRQPELANFELPDHWIRDANAQKEAIPVDLLPAIYEVDGEKHAKLKEQYDAQIAEEDRLAAEEGKEIKRKEGVSREDWFKDEPQSWFD